MVTFGSATTVLDKLVALRERTGPFGVLTMLTHEWDRPDFCQRSMRALVEEVMPALSRHADAAKAA
jgi:alkanesulfonate monooxygenase SsuD/methylene tetrahydromethanopterin reductase-like flavin-dependent oxidoreductase (luciferase family)